MYDRDLAIDLEVLLPPEGEYVRIPFEDPTTGSPPAVLTPTAQLSTWGPLVTPQVVYAEFRAVALLVQCVAQLTTGQGGLSDSQPGLIVTVDSSVNDGGVEMVYGPQILLLTPVAVTSGGNTWYVAEDLIVFLRVGPHLKPDMLVTISGRVLLPIGIGTGTVKIGLVAELIADVLYDPMSEAIAALKMLQAAKADGVDHDQRPTVKLAEIMRRAGVGSYDDVPGRDRG